MKYIYRLAIENSAKHHAVSYAMIKEYGGPEKFFNHFECLGLDMSTKDCIREMLEPSILSALNTSVTIIEVQR